MGYSIYLLNQSFIDIPEAVLRTQANVLARISVFVVSNEECELNPQSVTSLLSDFSYNLKDATW